MEAYWWAVLKIGERNLKFMALRHLQVEGRLAENLNENDGRH